jgi:uncharacterized protein involved in outer membrane biogenesis
MKVVKTIVLCLVVLLAVLIGAAMFYGGAMVKSAVETMGPKVLGVPVTLKGALFFPVRGKAVLTGLVIGNPEGFKSPSLFELHEVSVSLDLATLFSDTIVIRQVRIDAPAITYEGSMKGSNITKLMENIKRGKKGGVKEGKAEKPEEAAKGGEKKVIIKEFSMENAKVAADLKELGGRGITVVVPSVHLTDIGEKEGGTSPAAASAAILGAVLKGVTGSLASSEEVLEKGLKFVEEGGAAELKAAGKEAGKVIKSISGLFGKDKKTE